MEKKLHRIYWLIFLTFIILGVGEYVIYQKVMTINKVVSEQFMQIKESARPTSTPIPTMKLIKK